jgi:hypothetical protein
MTSIGGLLAILGFGSLVLPAFGLQFKLLSAVEGAQPWFGVVLGVVGLVLLVVGFMQNGKQQEQQPQQPQQT